MVAVMETYLVPEAPPSAGLGVHVLELADQIGNQNQDGFFSFFYDGSSIGDTTDMLFSNGWNLAGTERTVDEAPGSASIETFRMWERRLDGLERYVSTRTGRRA